MKKAALILYKSSLDLNKYKESLNYYTSYIVLCDSLKNKDTEKAIIHQQIKYGFEEKEQLRVADEEKQTLIREEARIRNNILIGAILIGLILLIVFTFFLVL